MRIAASVMREEAGRVADSHLCLLVRLPADHAAAYLVDAGFGGSLMQPLALGTAELAQRPYQVGTRRLNDGYWRFWENDGGGEFSFDFLPLAGDEQAMADRCRYLQRDPRSSFVANLVAQRRIGDRHAALRGRVLRVMGAAGADETVLGSAEELVQVLQSTFALDVPEIASVWPRICARHEQLFD